MSCSTFFFFLSHQLARKKFLIVPECTHFLALQLIDKKRKEKKVIVHLHEVTVLWTWTRIFMLDNQAFTVAPC